MSRHAPALPARRHLLVALVTLGLGVPAAARDAWPDAADPASDEPERRRGDVPLAREAASYDDALSTWRGPDDINAWIGTRFEYDRARALQLSETQRQAGAPLPILEPATFYRTPRGVCVDLARFAVETLQRIDPGADAQYLMIEFDPVTIAGQLLRRHWVATYRQAGQRYVFADSKRPGERAGPYAGIDAFIADYARYRGRAIVAWREATSFERRRRQPATRSARQDRPAE
jgi:hypothetical protein